MGNERLQGVKVLLLAACVLSANFIATRPAPDKVTQTPQATKPQIILALR